MLKFRYLLIGLILGLLLGWIWFGGESRENLRPVPERATPRTTGRRSKDNLTEIDGIGPAYERALNQLGITTFEQLIAQDADSLAAKLSARVTAERIRREQWIEQAKKLAQ